MVSKIYLLLLLGVSCLLLFTSNNYANDIFYDMEEVSNIQIGKCAYVWGWYEPDSANYFVFSGLWNNADGSPGSGTAVVKTTDPSNPVYVGTIPMGRSQDIKIVNNTLYAIDWPPINGNKFWMVSLKSEWPYYDDATLVGIPFDDNSLDTIDQCDTIPLGSGHTLFTTEDYLIMPEMGTNDCAAKLYISSGSASSINLLIESWSNRSACRSSILSLI